MWSFPCWLAYWTVYTLSYLGDPILPIVVKSPYDRSERLKYLSVGFLYQTVRTGMISYCKRLINAKLHAGSFKTPIRCWIVWPLGVIKGQIKCVIRACSTAAADLSGTGDRTPCLLKWSIMASKYWDPSWLFGSFCHQFHFVCTQKN